MFVNFGPEDDVLHSKPFIQEEVEYNLIHMIAENPESLRLKTSENDLLIAHSPEYNPWLWISPETDAVKRGSMMQELAEMLVDRGLPGVTGTRETAQLFAGVYGKLTGRTASIYMMLEAYHCTEVQKPDQVSGSLVQAEAGDIPLVAGYLACFAEDAFGIRRAPEEFTGNAEACIKSGRLYLWMDQGQPVSMANLAHQSRRHMRMNEVFTPRQFRKRGYASAVVAELCSQLLDKGITPMLYADAANPDSNKVYQAVGFKRTGSVADLRFD